MPDFRCGPIFIIRHRFDQHSDARRTISFIGQLFVHYAFKLTCAASDSPIDIGLGHILSPGCKYRRSKPGIDVDVPTALTRRNRDLLDQLCKYPTSLGIVLLFFSFYGTPFGMPGHVTSLPVEPLTVPSPPVSPSRYCWMYLGPVWQ